MKAQPIRVKARTSNVQHPAVIAGWLGKDGPGTYLWLGVTMPNGEDVCTGILDGAQLYRLAKAIVRRFESK